MGGGKAAGASTAGDVARGRCCEGRREIRGKGRREAGVGRWREVPASAPASPRRLGRVVALSRHGITICGKGAGAKEIR